MPRPLRFRAPRNGAARLRRTARHRSALRRGVLLCESLEPRLLLAGDVTAGLGDLAPGKSITLQYEATVDAPLPKGIDHVFNQATVSGDNFADVVSDPTNTPIDQAPQVADVFVRGSGWDFDFLTELDTLGVGDPFFGYRIPDATPNALGQTQLDPLPWVDLDQVSIRFTEQVDIELVDLQLQSVAPITVTTFNYDAPTSTATWDLSAPIGANKLRVVLPDGAVTDAAGNQSLDGEWIDGAATFNSGNGAEGGPFSFRVDVAPGNISGDGSTDIDDTLGIRNRQFTSLAAPGPNGVGGSYSVLHDVNGDGTVNILDTIATRNRQLTSLPGTEPGGTPGSGWTPDALPPPDPGPGVPGALDVTKTVTLAVDVDGDGEADPGDTLRYEVTIANNSETTAENVQLDDCLHPNLIAGNLGPAALPDSYGTAQDVPLTEAAGSGVRANDFDLDGVTPSGSLAVTPIVAGPTALGGTIDLAADGSFTYTPPGGATGVMDSFTYTVVDGDFLVGTGTAMIAIGPAGPGGPPTANPDAFDALGNVGITVPVGGGVLNGAGADSGTGTLNVTKVQGVGANVGNATATSGAGSVTLAGDGSFTYVSAPGFEGSDTFTYTVTDDVGDAQTTVTITVADTIWFIDNSSGGSNQGTLADPFQSIAAFNGSTDPGDDIYLAETGTNYSTGIVLANSQQLIGEGTTGASLAAVLGITSPTFGDALPAIGGAPPIITPTSGHGITLASGNTIRGLNVENGAGYGIFGSGALGTTNVSEVALTNNVFEELELTGASGAFNFDDGTIVCVSTDAIHIEGGSVAVTFTETTLTHSGGRAIRIDGGHSGSFSFLDDGTNAIAQTGGVGVSIDGSSGTYDIDNLTVSGASTGILVNNSGAATSTFRDVTITGTTGVNLTGGGTVTFGTVDGANTVSATFGAALSATNTTIGAAGFTFQSLSSSDATNGIVLNNTGALGGLTVTGDGGAAQNASGGTLQNTSGDAISLTDTRDVVLNQMLIDGTGRHGVFGTGVVNLTVNNSVFEDTGNAAGEDAFSFRTDLAGSDNNISGQFTLNNVDVTRYAENGINIFAEAGALAVDVINGSDFVDGGDFTGGPATQGQAIIIETEGTAGVDLNVNGSLFDDVESDAVRLEAGGSGFNHADVIDNNVTDPGGPDNEPNGGSFHMIVTDAATLSFDIRGNTQNDLPGDGIIVAATGDGGNIEGQIGGPNLADGNTINGGVDPFGFPVSDGILVTDIGVNATIAETMTLLIQNNTIDLNNGDDGIQFAVGDSDGTYNITIEDNVISNTGSEGIRFFFDDDNDLSPILELRVVDNSFSGIGDGAIELATRDSAIACAHIAGNDNGSGGSPGEILLDERDTSSIEITQASTAALATANNGATVTVQTNPVSFGGTCTNPPLPFPAQLAAAAGEGPGGGPALTGAELEGVATAAVARLVATGFPDADLATLADVQFEVADLAGGLLGTASNGVIQIDATAAGWGWFVDATPAADEEFAADGVADASSEAHGRMDLLTAVMHELGHLLGRDHSDDPTDLMAESLATGTRLSPAPGDVFDEVFAEIGGEL